MNVPDIDTRVLTYLVWGMGTTIVYFIVMARRFNDLRLRRDRRSKREFLVTLGLFVVALCANLAVIVVLFGETTLDMRRALSALALGAFTAVGVLMLFEPSAGKGKGKPA